MANSCHTDNNWCYNCTKHFSNGIIRNSKVYCSESCYDWVHKKAHFTPTMDTVPTTKFIRPSSKSYRAMVQRIEKQCNYCFDTFDKNTTQGIDYGPMWFCCQHHLNLANPRPKVMMAPAVPIGHYHITPQALPHFMGQRIIGPFVGGQFIGPF
jgi:hypothetical protein